MPIGTIKSINERGFGFLAAEDGVEYFFHRSSVEGGAFESLTRGSQVEFEIEASTRGPRAGRVRAASWLRRPSASRRSSAPFVGFIRTFPQLVTRFTIPGSAGSYTMGGERPASLT